MPQWEYGGYVRAAYSQSESEKVFEKKVPKEGSACCLLFAS